ncbi:hypothetical protein M9Y10_005371 [Tritrichomonas musculus]|uniref:Uncharacterized protein n=1 Tax=Tritrichomonas musculus TaxID=1915356 RepID=A0ABR2JM33_9EUKA
MTQDDELPPETGVDYLTQSIQTLSDIIHLCQQNNELTPLAVQRLNELTLSFENSYETDPSNGLGNSSNKCRAQRDIEEHIALCRKMQRPIKPTSVVYRDIASSLSKKKELPFDPKATKKKSDLFKWFDEHWLQIKDQFFLLLDKHPLAQGTKETPLE